jgi:hypothetical protein
LPTPRASNDVDRHPAADFIAGQPLGLQMQSWRAHGWQSRSAVQRQIGIDGFHTVGIID